MAPWHAPSVGDDDDDEMMIMTVTMMMTRTMMITSTCGILHCNNMNVYEVQQRQSIGLDPVVKKNLWC